MQNDREEQKKWFARLVNEDSDVALVRIFECFLEAAPQKILQISIILSGEEKISSECSNSSAIFIEINENVCFSSATNAEFVFINV